MAGAFLVNHSIVKQNQSKHNITFDIQLKTTLLPSVDSGNYSSALRCYLEAGAVASSFFYSPVPSTVWDDQVQILHACCKVASVLNIAT